MNFSHIVKDSISLPDHGGEDDGSRQKTDHSARHRRAPGIIQVFPHDPAFSIPQGFEHADLGSLLFHHPVHGRHADQRGNQKEKCREYPGYARHDVRVVFEQGVSQIAVPAQHIDFRLFDLIQIALRIFDLLPGFGSFLFQLLSSVLVFLSAFGQFLTGLFQLLQVVLDLLPPVFQPGLGIPQLLPALFQRRLPGRDLIQLRLQSRFLLFQLAELRFQRRPLRRIAGASRSVQSRQGRFQLLAGLGELLLSGLRLAPSLRELFFILCEFLPSGIDFRLGRIQLILRILQLSLTVRDLGFSVLQPGSGVIQFRLRFLRLFLQLGFRVRDLPAGVGNDAFISLQGRFFGQRLRPIHQVFHRFLIFIAVELVVPIHAQKNFRITVVRKPFGRQINEPLNPPVSQRRRSPLVVHIGGGIHPPHDLVFRFRKQILRLFFIMFRYRQGRPDGFLRERFRIHRAFPSRFGKPSGNQNHLILHIEQSLCREHQFLAAFVDRQEIRGDRAFHGFQPVDFLQPVHRVPVEPQGGNEPDIIQVVFIHIIAARPDHIRRGNHQAGEKPYPERHDRKDRQIAPETVPDFPPRGLLHR